MHNIRTMLRQHPLEALSLSRIPAMAFWPCFSVFRMQGFFFCHGARPAKRLGGNFL